MDLDRFKKGLKHNDYDYVRDIIESYTEQNGENHLFTGACTRILQAELGRSENHLAHVIRLAGNKNSNTNSATI